VAHVYHPELWEELVAHLAAIPVDFDLIVTNSSGAPLNIDLARLPAARHAIALDVENRGRDLWPLAQVVNAGLLDSYDLVIKVHTKRSPWRGAHGGLAGTGDAWRGELLSALLGDARNVSVILDAFAESADLGIVTADDSVLGSEFWGDNEAVTASLLRRMRPEPDHAGLTFAAGSIYWIRGPILRRLRALSLTAADFESEEGQVDGTTAHALERVIGLLTLDAGLRVVGRSQLPATQELVTP
jgi:lipopolysaccharide biosynthesis protein